LSSCLFQRMFLPLRKCDCNTSTRLSRLNLTSCLHTHTHTNGISIALDLALQLLSPTDDPSRGSCIKAHSLLPFMGDFPLYRDAMLSLCYERSKIPYSAGCCSRNGASANGSFRYRCCGPSDADAAAFNRCSQWRGREIRASQQRREVKR